MIPAIIAGSVLTSIVGYAFWKEYQNTKPATTNATTGQLSLVNGRVYTVKFFTPTGAAPTLGPTGWMPQGNSLQKVATNVTIPSATTPYDAWQMQAAWNGKSGTFYMVNPDVAGPNIVASVA